MRTIGVVTVARSDYGIYQPVLQRIQEDPDLRLRLIVTGMHLSPEFGLNVRTIEQDGFEIGERIEMLLSSDTPEGIAKSMGLGTIGFAAVGTLFSTIAANTRAREVMLPILLFPISVPVLLAAVKGTAQILNQGVNWDKLLPWLKVLIGFDVIFIVACMLLYEYALEE